VRIRNVWILVAVLVALVALAVGGVIDMDDTRQVGPFLVG
jgi:hypothetical protein